MIKGLVSVAWADGKVTESEHEVIDALLDAYGASPSEKAEIIAYSRTPRTIEDIPIHDLSGDDRRVLLGHAVTITYVDGEQHDLEREVLQKLSLKLRIPPGEARVLIDDAGRRARDQLGVS